MGTRNSLGSIYDLAKETGLSTSTVSRVLNQRGRISRETRERVLAAARKAGFRPRTSVRQQTVAVVLDRIRYASHGGFLPTMLTHLITGLARYNLAVEIYTEDNVERIGTRFVDGVLALTWSQTTIDRLRELKRVPVVVINRLDLGEFSTAATDHFEGGQIVAEHLIEYGHRRIGFVGEEPDWGASQRVEGLRQTLKAHGGDPSHVCVAFTQHQPVERAMRRLIEQKVTAVFLTGEDNAIEATQTLKHGLGLRIPDQLSVVGIENLAVSRFLEPPITSLAQPLADLATAALELLMQQLKSNDDTPRQRILNNRLIVRRSVAPPPTD